MKTKAIISFTASLALVAAVFTSCGNEPEADNGPVPVQFTSAIAQPGNATQTRAANNAWTQNDAIGVFMVNTTTTTISEGALNRQHTANATGSAAFSPAAGNAIYYPVDGSSVDFIAYYPYKNGATLGAAYSVNVATQTSQAGIDLLWSNDATGKDKRSGAVALTFHHQLSKVIIKTVAGTGLDATSLMGMTVSITGMNTTADFDLATGALSGVGTPAAIAPVRTNTPTAVLTPTYEAIVLPASAFAAGALTMDFALNNAKAEVFKWASPAGHDFEAGKVYEYTMTINRTGVSFNCTITDWDTVTQRQGIAN